MPTTEEEEMLLISCRHCNGIKNLSVWPTIHSDDKDRKETTDLLDDGNKPSIIPLNEYKNYHGANAMICNTHIGNLNH